MSALDFGTKLSKVTKGRHRRGPPVSTKGDFWVAKCYHEEKGSDFPVGKAGLTRKTCLKTTLWMSYQSNGGRQGTDQRQTPPSGCLCRLPSMINHGVGGGYYSEVSVPHPLAVISSVNAHDDWLGNQRITADPGATRGWACWPPQSKNPDHFTVGLLYTQMQPTADCVVCTYWKKSEYKWTCTVQTVMFCISIPLYLFLISFFIFNFWMFCNTHNKLT